jgi:ribokinase
MRGGIVQLHAIGFGALNLDELWDVSDDFIASLGLEAGREYIRDVDWLTELYPRLRAQGVMKAIDPGGSAANMIAALHRMGFATGFYGVTGEADVGRLRLDELGRAQDLRIRTTAQPAGRCLSLVHGTDVRRDRTLVIFPNANDLAALHVPDAGYFQQARWVHMTSFVSQAVLVAQAVVARNLEPPTRLSFDPGVVYCRLGVAELRPILERTAVLFITAEEMEMLTLEHTLDAGTEMLSRIGVGIIVVKLGAHGLIAFHAGQSIHQPAVTPMEIRDPTGAGDVAAAGFLAAMLRSLALHECLEVAAKCAAKSIGGYGRAAYPDGSLLKEYVASR